MLVPPFLTGPHSLARRSWAAEVLSQYFDRRRSNALDPYYTGSMFDRIGSREDRVSNQITAEDLVALTTLSAGVPAVAALRVLGPAAEQLSEHLAKVDPELTLARATDEDLNGQSAVGMMWSELRSMKVGFGPVATSKLLARKRPNLIPIYDKQIDALLQLRGTWDYWREIRELLGPPSSPIYEFLAASHEDARLNAEISSIRTFDVLGWMWQTEKRVRGSLPQL